MKEAIRRAIVEDHERVRMGVSRVLEGESGIRLVGEAENGAEALDLARRENAELHSRIADLQSQLDKLQRLLQLKDSQLATLQAQLAAQQAAQQPLAHTQP